jgi:MHS family alpha-ketoglutarate permease-like MFS transporter
MLADAGQQRRNVRFAIACGAIGTFIEWYDWFIYGILATVFSQQIFPSKTAIASLMAALFTYAIGFLVRPLGSLVLSPLGDRYGRRTAMAVTIGLMAAGSVLVAVTPTYAQIGVFAPILFLVARVMQGLSAGGEIQSAIPFMVEHAPANRKGLAGSFANVASGCATLVATGISGLLAWLLSDADLHAWGWRIPFALGGLLGLFGLYLRWGVPETPVFEQVKRAGAVAATPVRDVLRRHPLALLQIAALQATTVAYYIWATFLPTYAKLTTGQALVGSFAAGTIGVAVFTVLVPCFGYLSDRLQNRKIFALASAFGVVVLLYPLFTLLSAGGFFNYLIVSTVGWALLSMVFGVYPALFTELFPPELRATGIGLPYHITTALLGGTAPLLAAWFISLGMPMATCYYVMAVMLVCGLIYLTIPPMLRTDLAMPARSPAE